jgi:predicted RNA-binding protein with PIN domain
VPGVVVVVDGYNVAKTAWPDLDLESQREHLVGALENLVRRSGTRVRVVFDGSDVVGWGTARRLVHVQFSPPGVIADDLIREIVAGLDDSQPIVVVSSDRDLVASVRTSGANSLAARQFVDAVIR